MSYVRPPRTTMLVPSPLRISYRLSFLHRHFSNFRTLSGISSSPIGAAEVRSTRLSAPASSEVRFELSPVPPNPLGEGRWIKTAGALIIGCVSRRSLL